MHNFSFGARIFPCFLRLLAPSSFVKHPFCFYRDYPSYLHFGVFPDCRCDPLVFMCCLFSLKGFLDKAAMDYTTSLSIRPLHPKTLYSRALCRESEGDFHGRSNQRISDLLSLHAAVCVCVSLVAFLTICLCVFYVNLSVFLEVCYLSVYRCPSA